MNLFMTEHYFTEKPTSRLIIKQIKEILRDNEIELYTASGLFSPDQVDKGTKLLIEKSVIQENSKILDLGCGYGAIGISLKIIFPLIDLTLSDINERAVQITSRNLDFHKLNGKIIQSNGFEKINENFDIILLNPPQTAGKKLCFKLIEDAKSHLLQNGSLQLVARHNKGGKELSKKMLEVFGNVKDIAKSSGYRIYISKNSGKNL